MAEPWLDITGLMLMALGIVAVAQKIHGPFWGLLLFVAGLSLGFIAEFLTIYDHKQRAKGYIASLEPSQRDKARQYVAEARLLKRPVLTISLDMVFVAVGITFGLVAIHPTVNDEPSASTWFLIALIGCAILYLRVRQKSKLSEFVYEHVRKTYTNQ